MNFLKCFLALTFVFTSYSYSADMEKYRKKTEELEEAGNYAEALTRHIWFHNNCLKHEPSLVGVRLSFALGDWKRLADKYPPALKAMKHIRDEKERKV